MKCSNLLHFWRQRFHQPSCACLTLSWKITFLPVYLRCTREGNTTRQSPPRRPDTMVLCQSVQSHCQPPSPLPLQLLKTHLAHLSLQQCPHLLPQPLLSWQGAGSMWGPGKRAIVSLILSQTSRVETYGNWEKWKRNKWKERERGNYALTSFPTSFPKSLSLTRCVP